MKDFLDFLIPGYGTTELRAIKGGQVSQSFIESAFRDSLIAQAAYLDKLGWDVYVGVLPRKGDKGRAEDCWPTTTVLWADVDAKAFSPDIGPLDEHGGYKDRALYAIQSFPVAPCVLIDSGHGYHAYWKLKNAELFSTAQTVMKAIAKWVNGDHVHDAARVLRLPSTSNHKDPQNPVPVRLLKLDTLRKYHLSDFDEIVLAMEEPPRPRIQTERRQDAADWLKDFLDTEPPKGSRSEALFKAVKSLDRLGYSFEDILTVVMNSPVGVKAQEKGERWAEQDIARTMRKS